MLLFTLVSVYLSSFWLIWTSSPRFTTTTSIPTRSRFERLYYGYGEVRRADDSSSPSSIDGVVSLVDSGENNLPSSDTPCFITGDCLFNSGKNPKISSLPIKQAFSSKPRMLIFWAWPYAKDFRWVHWGLYLEFNAIFLFYEE
ncbi:unnamed protein product [Brassica oleracea]